MFNPSSNTALFCLADTALSSHSSLTPSLWRGQVFQPGRPTVHGQEHGRPSNRVGEPCTARNTVSRPTGPANRARPGTRSAVQPGRRTVHGQEHGQPANWAGQPCTARNTVSRPTGSANRARPGTRSAVQPGRRTVHGQEHGQPANRVGQPCTARNTVSWAHGQHGQP